MAVDLNTTGNGNVNPPRIASYNQNGFASDFAGFYGLNGVLNLGDVDHAPGTWALSSLQLTTSTLPNAISHQSYSTTLSATGGIGTGYVWLTSGSLPNGFSLSSAGVLSSTGTPSASPRTYTLSVKVTDSAGNAAPQQLSLVVQSPPLPAVTILDPVPLLLDGPRITGTRRADLALKGRQVNGIAADGIAQVVIRVPVLAAGDQVAATLFSDQCPDPTNCSPSGFSDDDGGLFNVGGQVTASQSLANNATDTADSTTIDAFVAYRAPTDFVRPSLAAADSQLASRTVYLQLSYSSGGTVYGSQILPLPIVRPPVDLVHGLWGDISVWYYSFSSLMTDQRFVTSPLSYDAPVSRITASSPPYPASVLSNNVRANSFGFVYNALPILNQINQTIATFKVLANVAAVQVDVVAHSMGGNIIRALPRLPTFKTSQNFAQGSIHKVITIGTPHLGTPLAAQFLQAANTCVSQQFASQGYIAASTFWIGGTAYDGAVGDLEGDGIGGNLSSALFALYASNLHSFRTALIAGITTPQNLSTLRSTPASSFLYDWCGLVKREPLALEFISTGWNAVFFGAMNDAIVPLTSAINQASSGSGSPGAFMTIDGVVHSQGTIDLGFGGPSLLSSPRVVPDVINLLNTPVSNHGVFILL